jgi:hypothetical protein
VHLVRAGDLPGRQIQRVCGEVFGLTVRSRNAFSQFGAGFKSMYGCATAAASAALRRGLMHGEHRARGFFARLDLHIADFNMGFDTVSDAYPFVDH